VVSHELGHTVHYNNMGNIQYWQAEDYIIESWADFVKWHMSMLEYRALGLEQVSLNTLNTILSKQWWPYVQSGSLDIDNQPEYSSIFIDLVDDFDQSTANTATITYPTDSVTGYAASKLNEIVLDSYGWLSLTTHLKSNKPVGVTDALIDQLMTRYGEVCK
jgi:hypothetical protein